MYNYTEDGGKETLNTGTFTRHLTFIAYAAHARVLHAGHSHCGLRASHLRVVGESITQLIHGATVLSRFTCANFVISSHRFSITGVNDKLQINFCS